MFKFFKALFSKEVPNCCKYEGVLRQIFMQEKYVAPGKFAPPISPKWMPHTVAKPEYTGKIKLPSTVAPVTNLSI